MGLQYSGKISTEGLLVALNAADVISNPTQGNGFLYNLVKFDGSLATVANGTTSSRIVTLDGTNDYIYVNNSISSPTLSPSGATFNIWFKPSSGVFDYRANSLISRGNYNTAGGFFIHMFTNTVSLNGPSVQASFSYSTTTNYSYDSTTAYSLRGFNVWSNLTVVCDTSISIYIDGVHKETRGRSFPRIIYGNDAINTGGDTDLVLLSGLSYYTTISNGYWEPYKGDFGNFQMWDRRLTATEILDNYNIMKSRFGL
jgi:hypothetical protein